MGKIEYKMEQENPGFKQGQKLIDLVVQELKEKAGEQKLEEVKNLNLNLAATEKKPHAHRHYIT